MVILALETVDARAAASRSLRRTTSRRRDGRRRAHARRASARRSRSTGSRAHGRTLADVDRLRGRRRPRIVHRTARRHGGDPGPRARAPAGASSPCRRSRRWRAAGSTHGIRTPARRRRVPRRPARRRVRRRVRRDAARVRSTTARVAARRRASRRPTTSRRAGARCAGAAPITIVGDGARRYRGRRSAARLPDVAIVDAADAARRRRPRGSPRGTRRGRRAARAAADLPPPARRRAGARARAKRAPADRARRTFTIARASTADDLAAVEALQRQTFTNPWGAEAIRWELENTDVARLYVMRDARRARSSPTARAGWSSTSCTSTAWRSIEPGAGAGSRAGCSQHVLRDAVAPAARGGDARGAAVERRGARAVRRPRIPRRRRAARLLPGSARGRADPVAPRTWRDRTDWAAECSR